MATENQNQNSLKDIAAAAEEEKLKKLENYLNDKGFNRGKVRKDLKRLDIESAQKLREKFALFFPSKGKYVFYEEVDKFASLDEIVQRVEDWGHKNGGNYERLFKGRSGFSVEDWEIREKICWLSVMEWLQNCQRIGNDLKKDAKI